MASRNDEDLGMFSNIYQSLTDRGPNKRRIKPLEGNLLQMTFGMGSSDEEDSDFVAHEHKGDSDDDASELDTSQEAQNSQDSQDEPGAHQRRSSDAGKMMSLSDVSEVDEADVSASDSDADATHSGSSHESDSDSGDDDEDSASGNASSSSNSKMAAGAPKVIEDFLNQDFNSDSDSSFCPGEPSGNDSDAECKPVERKRLRRRSVSKHSTAAGGGGDFTLGDVIAAMSGQTTSSHPLICSVCLEQATKNTTDAGGDKDDDDDIDELLQCDACGVAVHEGCFGLGADSSSNGSSGEDEDGSESPPKLESWFCDSCRAGAKPFCALCLKGGAGVYKPTSDGRWVHAICTLYTPGVTYGRLKYLSPVRLHGIARSRWNAKTCELCKGSETAAMGICIQCDAGLCKARFHVTCAQKHGLLCEAPSHEVVADPFYALCPQHGDKTVSKTRMRRYVIAGKQCEAFTPVLDESTITAALEKARLRYARVAPLRVYRQTPVSSSSSSDEKASKTTKERGSHPVALPEPMQPVNTSLSKEFVEYKQSRDSEIRHLEQSWQEKDKSCINLLEEKDTWEGNFEKVSGKVRSLRNENASLRNAGTSLLQTVATLQARPLQVPAYFVEDVIGKKLTQQRSQDQQKEKSELKKKQRQAAEKRMAEAAKAMKAVASSKTQQQQLQQRRQGKKKKPERTTRKPFLHAVGPVSLDLKCCRCLKSEDNENIIDCDKCHQAYHIYCLDPPLKRKPKKTNLCGWQCLDCDTSDSDFYWRPTQKGEDEKAVKEEAGVTPEPSSVTKRGRVVQRTTKLCVSPTPIQPKKRKPVHHRRQSRAASIGSSDGGAGTTADAGASPGGATAGDSSSAPAKKRVARHSLIRVKKKKKDSDDRTECSVCKQAGSNTTLVRCDNCQKCFHFPCLDPPRKSSPKTRGYSWHCTDCDSSNSDSDRGDLVNDLVGNEDILDQAEAAVRKHSPAARKAKQAAAPNPPPPAVSGDATVATAVPVVNKLPPAVAPVSVTTGTTPAAFGGAPPITTQNGISMMTAQLIAHPPQQNGI